MSANIEFAFISSIIQSGNYHTVDKMRITEDYFSSPQAREVFRYLNETYHGAMTSGQVPSPELINLRFPGIHLPYAKDSVDMLGSELRKAKIRMELLKLSQNIQIAAEADPLAALAELTAEHQRLSGFSEIGEDLSMAGAYDMLKQEYEMIQDKKGLVGIPYPWEVLNEETQGMQAGQFIVLFGRPKSMKSWMAIHIGAHAYMAGRRRVLYYTREMNPKMVAKRVACRLAKVDYGKFVKGKLQPSEKERVFLILKELLEDEKMAGAHGIHQPYFIITTDRSTKMGGSGGGVAWLQAKIRDLKPDIVIVDGMYLLRDDRTNTRTVDWKQIAHISQDLKLTAQDFEIPVIGVTQANRSSDKATGDDLTELAFSDSLGQDADAVFRVSKKKNPETQADELYIRAPGLREGVFDGMVIHGQPATNFEFIRTLTSVDTEGDYEKPKGHQGPHNGGSSFRKDFKDPRIPLKTLK